MSGTYWQTIETHGPARETPAPPPLYRGRPTSHYTDTPQEPAYDESTLEILDVRFYVCAPTDVSRLYEFDRTAKEALRNGIERGEITDRGIVYDIANRHVYAVIGMSDRAGVPIEFEGMNEQKILEQTHWAQRITPNSSSECAFSAGWDAGMKYQAQLQSRDEAVQPEAGCAG